MLAPATSLAFPRDWSRLSQSGRWWFVEKRCTAAMSIALRVFVGGFCCGGNFAPCAEIRMGEGLGCTGTVAIGWLTLMTEGRIFHRCRVGERFDFDWNY